MKTLDIAFGLYSHYEKVEEINNYYGLLAIYGLIQNSYESQDAKHMERCREILAQYPDGVRHPYYNFPCYRYGGNAQAWAIYKGMVEKADRNLEDFAEQTLAGEKEEHGILCMPGRKEEGWIWIDTVTAITPFMLFAGLVCGKQEYIDFAAQQCILMYEALLDDSCGLLHQCRGFRDVKGLRSEDHWSRGNGWGYLALAELVEHLPQDSMHREKAEKYFCDLTDALITYQNERGLWRQEITAGHSWEESSGSALFIYGIGIGLRTGLLKGSKYQEAFRKGLEGLVQYCINDDFSTEMSCPGCLCPGEGERKGTIEAYITEKQPEKDEHHSFGTFMLALVEGHRNGFTEFPFFKTHRYWEQNMDAAYILKRDGVIMEQKAVESNLYQKIPVDNQLLTNDFWNGMQIVISDMAALYDETVERAVRVWIIKLPCQLATIDIVKATEKVTLCTHFSVNNRDNGLDTHIYSEQRLVLRREGRALKLFELLSVTDGVAEPARFDYDCAAMQDNSQPLADSVCTFRWEGRQGKEHLRLHTYVMDTGEEIVHWHVYLLEDNVVRMENPGADKWLDIKADMNQIVLWNEKGETYDIKVSCK